jgi:hypothetical protein
MTKKRNFIMNKKIHLIASALTLAAAGNANATLILPETGASELLFVLSYLGSDAAIYTQDLGVTIDGFDPTASRSWSLQTSITQLNSVVAAAPAIGAGYDFSSDAASWGWSIMAGGLGATDRVLVTTTRPADFSDGNTLNFSADTLNSGWKTAGLANGDRLNEAGTHLNTLNGSNWALLTSLNPTNAQQTTYELTGSRYRDFTVPTPMDGTASSYLFSGVFDVTAPPGTNQATQVRHPGLWSLQFTATGGTLSYTASAVPVPAAAWLFGSAIAGMIGIGRRRKG